MSYTGVMTYARRYILRENYVKFCLGFFFVLLLNLIFKQLFTPSLDQMGIYSLVNTPIWTNGIKSLLSTDPLSLLLPVQYPGADGKLLWWTTTLIPFYYLSQWLTPIGVYMVTSSLLIITTYICSWFLFPSLVLSSTLAMLFALGTQFNYALTYGVLLTLYILQSYITINITICIEIFRKKKVSISHYSLFFISLLFCILGSEFWLNFGVSFMLSLSFLILWASHHRSSIIKQRAMILLSIVFICFVCYLVEERHAARKYLEAGVEEELIFTYTNGILILEDMIVNYFTLLYMSISNYLPSFLFSSNSATYLGEARIIAEQHGYHPQKTHLVMASHLFLWRFYAGILSSIFFIGGWKWFRTCWQEKTNLRSLILFLLWMGVATGFSTHLIIKMRPYNSSPMLGYKAVFSTFSFTVLIAYWLASSKHYFKKLNHWRCVIVSVWLMALLSFFTRPAAINAGLAATGLVGYGDPALQVIRMLNK